MRTASREGHGQSFLRHPTPHGLRKSKEKVRLHALLQRGEKPCSAEFRLHHLSRCAGDAPFSGGHSQPLLEARFRSRRWRRARTRGTEAAAMTAGRLLPTGSATAPPMATTKFTLPVQPGSPLTATTPSTAIASSSTAGLARLRSRE